MARYFRLEEAQRMIPHVERGLRQLIQCKADHDEAENTLRTFTRRITMVGGMIVDRTQLVSARTRLDSTAQRLKELVEEIHGFGCQIKDLDMGLIDFPTLYRGQEVCLCWKLGESGIEFWHGQHEGFRGRKPIDQDFLDNHRGDALA